jgi:hypothetical protein
MTRIEPGAPIQARGLPIRYVTWCNGARSVEGQKRKSRPCGGMSAFAR